MKKSFKQGWGQAGLVLLAAAAAMLAGCGGGSSQIEPFAPTRIMAMGDEASYLTAEGKKYAVNAVDDTTLALKCQNNPIWVQALATQFGLVFPQCNPDNVATPKGIMYARPGAKVDGVKAQIDQQFSAGGFTSKDLVAILVGSNDLIDLYRQFPAQNRDTLLASAGERGRALADQVNRVANAGGRVLVVTLPDLGLTPYAAKEKATKTDTDRAALLSALTQAFNSQMRLNVINDGRMIGLVLGDEMTQAIAKYPEGFGYANITVGACKVALPDCTTKTLLDTASADTWLWADDYWLGNGGQNRLGLLAQTRARNNPF